jgi:plastocyanin
VQVPNIRKRPAIVRWLGIFALLIVPQVVQATQWQAKVGAQSRNKGRQVLAFLPNEIWIHEGDSIQWTFNVDEPHTLTFLKPGQVRPPFPAGCPGFGFSASPASFDGSACVSTAPFMAGQKFEVDFPAGGNFKFVCLIHANMTGVVHVLPLEEALPHSQHFYDEQAEDTAEQLLSDVDADHENEHSPGSNQVLAGTGEVLATPGGSHTLSVMRFVNHTIVIHAGQTVEWSNSDPVTAHTITFGTEPANPIPPAGKFSKDADGALHATISSASDSVHSGFIVAAPQDRIGLPQSPVPTTRFRITFTQPGTYPYICALHDTLGMKGTIIVLP